MNVTYRPATKTRKRLEKIGEELSTASPMKLLAQMRLAGFSDRAIAEKMEIPTKTVMRLLDGKNVPRVKLVIRGGVGNSRPWSEDQRQRRADAIREGVRAKKSVAMWSETETMAAYCEREFGITSRCTAYQRICHAMRKGMSVADAVTLGMRLPGWEALRARSAAPRGPDGKFCRSSESAGSNQT